MQHVSRRASQICGYLVVGLSLWWPAPGALAQEQPDTGLRAILPIDQVRIGMTGYGLTVFAGTRIEPFRVEVVAVMRNFAPGRGVIWVRCPDERMQKLGPVQGMSGSPIYLWSQPDATGQKPGTGGKLIGAFALGFSGTKDCYVGVQPIQQMRQVAQRAAVSMNHQLPATLGHGYVQQLATLINQCQLAPENAWQAQAVLRLARHQHPRLGAAPTTGPPPMPRPAHLVGQVQQMKLPVGVGSIQLAQTLAPALAPLGMMPVGLGTATPDMGQATAATAGHTAPLSTPPPGIDIEQIQLEPGSVLSIPLAFGDIDISALGTVTEVQPDGQVLAFGHGMFSQGPMAVPMATGYVHFVMPSLASSFKLGGSGVIRGAIVRDEHSAIVGNPNGQFAAAPVQVIVNNPAGRSQKRYQYHVVDHQRLTPLIVATVVLQSIMAQRNLPIENTLRLHGKLSFSGGRSVNLDRKMIDPSATNLVLALMPAIATMMQNPHESMHLESMEVTADIQPQIMAGSIVNAQVDKAEVAPGDTIGMTVQVQPYGSAPIKQQIKLPIPKSLKDGQYELIICDAKTYVQLLLDSRPHLLSTSNADDLLKVLQRILSVASDALYAVLQLPESGLAIGRQEMPQLPTSRRAMFDTPTSTLATPYVEWIEQIVPMGLVIEGNTKFTIGVRKALAEP